MSPARKYRLFLMSLAALGVSMPSALALDRTWIGGNVAWVDGGSAANWNPADEPDSVDTAIFNTANAVSLGSHMTVSGTVNGSIMALTLSGNIDLSLAGWDMTVNGLVQASGAGTTLIIPTGSFLSADSLTLDTSADMLLTGGGDLTVDGGSTTLTGVGTLLNVGVGSVFSADSISLSTSAILELEGGSISYATAGTSNAVLNINSTATLRGQGTITNADALSAVTSVIVNEGAISAQYLGIAIGTPPAGTLTLNDSDVDARIDLDGLIGNGILNVFGNQTLDINISPVTGDNFDGDINLFQNSTLDIEAAWALGTGTIDINNGALGGFPPISAGIAHINGGAFTQVGGTITVIDTDGTLQFNTTFAMTGGSLTNNGLVIFNANATIGAGASFNMPSSLSSITVNPGVTVTVNQANFNADGNGANTNLLTINAGGVLNLNIGTGGDNALTGAVQLNGGALGLTNSASNWSLDGALDTGAGTGVSTISGDPLTIQSIATITVATGSTLTISSPIIFSGGTYAGGGTFRVQTASTTSSNTTINVATFDFDGTGVGTLHVINDGVVMTLNSPNFDTDGDMDDPLTLGGNGAQFVVNGPVSWTMAGTLTTNTAAAGIATIGGTSAMNLLSALVVSGNTDITSNLTLGTTSVVSIAAGAVLDLSSQWATYDGTSISGLGTFDPGVQNTIIGDSAITSAIFDFDGGVWTIKDDATLNVNVADYDISATNRFDLTIGIKDGTLNVITGDAEFIMNGSLSFLPSAGNFAVWSGEPLDFGDDSLTPLNSFGGQWAIITVNGEGTSQIESQTDFNSDVQLVVYNNAELAFLTNSTVNFLPVNGTVNSSFSGSGSIVFNGAVNIFETTTLDFSTGLVDLDGHDFVGEIINIDAPFTINAATLTSFGKINGIGVNTIDIDNSAGTGVLTVNLDNPAALWTLNAPGVMNLVNDNVGVTLLAGSDLQANGTINVTGDVHTTAKITLGSTGIININTAGQPFRLGGGHVHSIEGGTVNGVGSLGADSGTRLYGFGTINTPIDFDGTAILLADDGVLSLNGAIVDVGTLGTWDDGILNVTSPWNTSVANTVSLSGGTITGALITNDGVSGIRGAGNVTARINNDSLLLANFGGPLIFQTAGNDNDWDGVGNAGTLMASNLGTLELRDIGAQFVFAGTVIVQAGSTVFTNGFAFDFNPGSSILLTNGTYESTNSTDIGGTLTVNAGPDSHIVLNNGTFLSFESTSSTTLNANLRLDNNNIIVEAGATFSGPGALNVIPGSHIVVNNLGNVGVLLLNQGGFRPGNSDGIGRIDIAEYQQTATGGLFMELAGTALNTFDRLVVSGEAALDGELDLDVDIPFIPTLGDTFNIISAAAGVSGTFNLITQSGVPDNLFLDVNYLPFAVQVVVVSHDYWDNTTSDALWSTANNWSDNTEPLATEAITFPFGFPNGDQIITLTNVETGLTIHLNDSYIFNEGSLTISGDHSVYVQNTREPTFNSALISSNGNFTLLAGFDSRLGINAAAFTATTVNVIGDDAELVLNASINAVFAPTMVILSDSAGLEFNPAGTLAVGANISGLGYLIHAGPGTTTLTGNNTYTGGTQLLNGVLSLGSANAISNAGTIDFLGGTLQFSAANTTDYSSRFSNAAGKQFKIDTNGQIVSLATALTSAGGSLTKIGTGTLRLLAANTYTGTTTISGGILQLGNGGATGALGSGAVTNNGTLQINRSGLVTINNAISGSGGLTHVGPGTTTLTGAYTATGSMMVSDGKLAFADTAAARQTAAVLVTASSLTVASGKTLDLGNHDMLIKSGGTAAFEAQIGAAYDFGLFDLPGITSATAGASGGLTTLGINSGDDYNNFGTSPGLFDGSAVVSGDTVIKYTYTGDLNLDGIVDDNDLFQFLGTYLGSQVGNYSFGDINYDSVVDDNDLFPFLGAYLSPPNPPLGGLDAPAVPSSLGGDSAVPEPATLGVLGLAVLALHIRRRRN